MFPAQGTEKRPPCSVNQPRALGGEHHAAIWTAFSAAAGAARRCPCPTPMTGQASPRDLQAVVFDMDGLLVDSEPLWFRAEGIVMDRLGGSWTEDDQHVLLGGSMPVTVAHLLSKASRPAEPDTVARWLVESMTQLLHAGPVPVMPGAVELVAEVAAGGLPRG